MAYDIGTARGVIEMEYNGRGIDQAQQDLGGLDKSGQQADKSMQNASKTTTRAGLAIAAGLGVAVASAANFEAKLSAIEAVSGATSSEMDKISDKALQLGADTKFSASEAATAMEELVKAGLTVDEVLNGAADSVVALAAAGEIELPEAATIAANAMNQFNLAAEDMVGVADTIAGAANASAIDVSQLGQSLQQVGAVANLAGLSFEDTATAIALMGNAGIKGSDAGTSLKTMLQNLQPQTEKQKALFEKLKITTEDGSNAFFDAQGNAKGLADISGVLNKALKGMTKQQKLAALEVMFGTDAIRAAAILANEGAKGFNKMSDAMGETTAAEVAAKRMDNFKGSAEQLLGSLETVGIQLGMVLIPVLSDIVDGITDVINVFSGLSGGTQAAIVWGAAVAAGALLIIGQLIKLIVWGKRVQIMLAGTRLAFIGTWAAALGPIALVIAAVVAIGIALVVLWKKSETFRDIVIGVWEAIKGAVLAVAAWFSGPFVAFWQAVWAKIVQIAQAVWNAIVAAIQAGFNLIKTIIVTYLTIIFGVWKALWNLFGPLVKAVFDLIVAIIKLAWVIIKGLTIIGIRNILAVVRAGWAVITAITRAAWQVVLAIIRAVWAVIGPIIKAGVAVAKGAIKAAWDFIKSITKTIWDSVVKTVADKIADIMKKVSEIEGKIVGFFAGAGKWLYHAGVEIVQGLIDGISSMISKVTDKISELTSKVSKFFPGSPVEEGPLKVLNRGHAGKQIVQMLIDGIESMTVPLSTAIDNSLAPSSSLAPVPVGVLPAPRSAAENSPSSRLKLVSGELRLDKSGKAFITGLAVDAVDDDDDYEDTLGRMAR